MKQQSYKKGKDYSYNQIEAFANENDYSIEDYGRKRIGENFLVLLHNDKDITISFILSGVRSNEYIYQCIYTDLNN